MAWNRFRRAVPSDDDVDDDVDVDDDDELFLWSM